jgi:hypothetical protein
MNDKAVWQWFGQAATALGLFLFTFTPIAAQFDSDPTNNTQAGANVLPLSPGAAISNQAYLASPGNDVDFYSVTLAMGDVLLGMTTPLNDLPSSFELPDTMASILSGGIQQTFSDDDFADELPFLESVHGSLFRFHSPAASAYHIGITGFEDEEFDGSTSGNAHGEVGPYVLTAGRVNPTVLGGGFDDTDPSNNAIVGADLISLGSLNASVAVSELLSEDVDFYALNLSQGAILSAMTAPLSDLPSSLDNPDTVLGLFDSSGTMLLVNDDAGDVGYSDLDPDLGSNYPLGAEGTFGSALRAVIPADGIYYLGITGYGDDNFSGTHEELGRYALLVGVHSDATPNSDGDYNSDGTVDAADYVAWRKTDGTQTGYDTWRTDFGAEWGNGAGVDAITAAPEPSTLAILIVAAVAIGICRS